MNVLETRTWNNKDVEQQGQGVGPEEGDLSTGKEASSRIFFFDTLVA